MKTGKVYLIGAGPGERDLLTVKGLKVLQQADVVIYDYLVDANVLKYTNPSAERFCADDICPKIETRIKKLDVRSQKYSDGFTKHKDLITELIIKKANEVKNVVRLKNGDPFIFGRANEEMSALVKNKIEFVVIPGVTAGIAAGCYTGIPLTSRECSSTVVFVTGHEAENKDTT